MTEQLNVQQMAQRLMTADNILILCHKNPDGDTIGCGSALYCALKALDKNVAVLCSDAIPNRYAFTNAHMFKGEFEPQTVVAVDVASVQLFGENNGMTQFSRHVDLCIERRVSKTYGVVISWVLIAFMLANSLVSGAAVLRQSQRYEGVPATHAWQQVLDDRFPDSRLAKIYPSMVRVEE